MKAAFALLMLVALAVPARAASVQNPYLTGPGKVAQPYAAQQNGLPPPPKLSCRVGLDRGWGALQIRNDGAAALPAGTGIQWLTSSGRSGVVRLRQRLDPGWLDYEAQLFPGTMADDNATCVAAVAVPPMLQGQQAYGQQTYGQQGYPLPGVATPPHLGCQVRLDGPWGALDLRNDGAAAIDAGTSIQWRTSAGRTGVAQLTSRLAPGWQTRLQSLFVRNAADYSSTCTAVILVPQGMPPQGTFTSPGNAYTGPSGSTLALPKSPARFEPPLSPHGQRLYACQSVGSDVCGAQVATLYCQQLGYGRATGYDTSHRGVPAETLTGQTCSQSKCRVFDYIACAP